MTTSDQAIASLRRARNERNGVNCRKLLTEAVRLADLWYSESQEPRALIVKSQAQGELAREGINSKQRSVAWITALRTVQRVDVMENVEVVEAHAELAIDCYQDRLSDMPQDHRVQLLRRARERVDKALDDSDGQGKANLLAKKAALLRAFSTAEISSNGRKARVLEALRCAALGNDLVSTPAIRLELALCEWAAARIEPTDLGYVERVRKVEDILLSTDLQNFEPAQLALFNFYRMTYRQLDCCEVTPVRLT